MFRLASQVVCLSIFLAATTLASADDLSSLARPQAGVLVLRGGQVLQGDITRAGDNYYLTLATGEISIRAADVELQCGDLDEAYEHRRKAVNLVRVDERIKLIEWCLQQDLFAAAAREIAEANTQWPTDPRIAALSRRLLLRGQTAKPNPGMDDRSTEPSFEQLDQLVRGLPPRAASGFTNAIQPLLLNQCATSACHGTHRSNEFALQRANMTRTPSRRLTLRNLGHTLAQIDRENPDASPLLACPTGQTDAPHAIVFNDTNSAAYRQLVDWVRLVAGQPATSTATVSGKPVNSALLQFAPAGSTAPRDPKASPPSDPSAMSKPAVQTASTEAAATFATTARGGLVRPNGTFDPLDPEVFNRRYFPQRDADAAMEILTGDDVEELASEPE